MAEPLPDDDARSPAPRPGRVVVIVYRGVGVACVGLGTAGVFLPLLPTTVFLIVAVWAFSRSSPELADRLRTHPRLGPPLVLWEEKRAIPRPAKALALGMMAVSWTVLLLASHNLLVLGGVGLLLLAVAGYVITRPSS